MGDIRDICERLYNVHPLRDDNKFLVLNVDNVMKITNKR